MGAEPNDKSLMSSENGNYKKGIFKHYAVSIGSNSMVPYINKGDVVIVEKLSEEEIDELKIDDVLIFKYNDKVLVHRIIRIIEADNTKYFYTKGDNNDSEDGHPIKVSNIIGKELTHIPYLGYPAVELNEIVNRQKN